VERCGPGIYDEEFLAKLRLTLKSREPLAERLALDPRQDSPAWAALLSPPERDAAFVAAMTHAARRVKDCAAVKGFFLSALPPPLGKTLAAALAPKHPHYCFW
jgi:hypothetical protein